MSKLGLVLHPEKTRMVDLRRGKGGFVFLGCTIRKRRSILRNPRWHFMQRWPSPKAMKRLRDRVQEMTDSRQSGKDVKQIIAQTESRASWLGKLLSDGNADRGSFSKWTASYTIALMRWLYRRGGQRTTRQDPLDRPTVSRYGSAPSAGHRVLPGASHISKIIGKPCAGKPHARFERGFDENRLAMWPILRHNLPMQSSWRRQRPRLAVALILGALGMRADTIERCNNLLNAALENKNPDTRKQAVVALSLAATADAQFARLEGDACRIRTWRCVRRRWAKLSRGEDPGGAGRIAQGAEGRCAGGQFAAAKALWTMEDLAGRGRCWRFGHESKASSGYISKQKRDAMRMLHTPRVLFLYAFRQSMGFVPLPGFGEGVSSMQALLTDPGVSGRATAALLLGKDKSPETLAALKDALLDLDWPVARRPCIRWRCATIPH